MQEFIKQFVPPILYSGLRGMKRKYSSDKISSYAKIDIDGRGNLVLTDSSYKINFKRVEIGHEVYFVPDYAMHPTACKEILAGRYYEPLTHELIRLLLDSRPGNLIHAGTFFGDMLPSFSKKCPGIVYAYEPVLENYVLAKLCIQQNNLTNVHLWNVGLGNDFSIAHIDTGEDAILHYGGSSQIGNVGQITTLARIDSFDLQDISVIQLDVEGFELQALKGAVNTIEACKPTILIEDNSNNCDTFLSGLGYLFVGNVPGLMVWSDKLNSITIRDIIQKL